MKAPIKNDSITILLCTLNFIWCDNMTEKYSSNRIKKIEDILNEISMRGYTIKDIDDLTIDEFKKLSYECWVIYNQIGKFEDEHYNLELEKVGIGKTKNSRDNLIKREMKDLRENVEIRFDFIIRILFERRHPITSYTKFVKLIDEEMKLVLLCPPYKLWEGGLHDMFRSINYNRKKAV
jgi:hypothetical protein